MRTFKDAVEEYTQAAKQVKKLIIEAWPRMALVLVGFALINLIICITAHQFK